MSHFDRPVFTELLPNVTQLRPLPGCLYICGTSVEERSEHVVAWEQSCDGVTFARLEEVDGTTVSVSLEGGSREVRLRSRRSVEGLLAEREYSGYYLDVTGLSHHVWAPLFRGLMSRREPLFGVYVEPGDYRHSDSPTEAAIFDLSERIQGIAPVAGFREFSGGRRGRSALCSTAGV